MHKVHKIHNTKFTRFNSQHKIHIYISHKNCTRTHISTCRTMRAPPACCSVAATRPRPASHKLMRVLGGHPTLGGRGLAPCCCASGGPGMAQRSGRAAPRHPSHGRRPLPPAWERIEEGIRREMKGRERMRKG
jgi:hypothetical protein